MARIKHFPSCFSCFTVLIYYYPTLAAKYVLHIQQITILECHEKTVSSVAQSCLTLYDTMNLSTPVLPVHQQLPESTQTHVHWVGDVIQPPHPLSSPFPSAFNLSQHQGLFNESVLRIRWPKCWSFSISPSNEYSGLISFTIDWFDHFFVQGTLKSLLQHHSSKASFLQCSAFFMVQLSHPYMTDGKAVGNQEKCLYHGIHSVVKLTNSHLFQVWKVFDIRDLKGKIRVFLGLSENSNECNYFI